jgi:hypothetical protein
MIAQNAFTGIDAHRLRLWKVSIAMKDYSREILKGVLGPNAIELFYWKKYSYVN